MNEQERTAAVLRSFVDPRWAERWMKAKDSKPPEKTPKDAVDTDDEG